MLVPVTSFLGLERLKSVKIVKNAVTSVGIIGMLVPVILRFSTWKASRWSRILSLLSVFRHFCGKACSRCFAFLDLERLKSIKIVKNSVTSVGIHGAPGQLGYTYTRQLEATQQAG